MDQVHLSAIHYGSPSTQCASNQGSGTAGNMMVCLPKQIPANEKECGNWPIKITGLSIFSRLHR
jgi:hypothetical protein